MHINIEIIYLFLILLLCVDFILIFFLFLKKIFLILNQLKTNQFSNYFKQILQNKFSGINLGYLKANKKLFLDNYILLKNSIILKNNIEKKLCALIKILKIDKKYLNQLKSRNSYKRLETATLLGYINLKTVKKGLLNAFQKEKKYYIKLIIANSLTDLNTTEAIPEILNSLKKSPKWYQQKIHTLLNQFNHSFYLYISYNNYSNLDQEIELAKINFAGFYIAKDLKLYLLEKVFSDNKTTAIAAAESLANLYYEELINEKFYYHKFREIQKIAVQILSNYKNTDSIEILINLLNTSNLKEEIIQSLSSIIKEEPSLINFLTEKFLTAQNKTIKKAIALALCSKIEYFLTKFISSNTIELKSLTKEIIYYGEIISTIGFLNRNKNIELENNILILIKELAENNKSLKNNFCQYLNSRIANKLTKEQVCAIEFENPQKIQHEKNKTIILFFLLIFSLLLFPLFYFIIHLPIIFKITLFDNIKIYVLDFNYYLIYYSFSINLIYFILLIFSFLNVQKQIKNWKLNNKPFLFKNKILPSISIIAPSYNEEANIIESTNSLLNLKYPYYEVIIVNDGSNDDTLNKLIEYFKLDRIYLNLKNKITTKPIRGIYINKSYPKLIIIDKVNGGKADSLNVGINVANNEYICSIDADSLLEPDSLLKMTDQNLYFEFETVASGGNILPINGCSIEKGIITNYKIPKNSLARFQTIEYLRAFMAGRIGWAYINSLLIISGAFGLFKKEEVLNIGGYLTEAGAYHKHTVGEDMDLVVRLARYIKEENKPYLINYTYNANCWTEVPEKYTTFFKQRDRWQRGLIDILIYHKKLLFNPKYKNIGLIAFPYFYIFEFLGPLLEFQGYIMVVLAIILGLLNYKIASLLFISTVLIGILISISTVLISSRLILKFKITEILILIIYAFIENFGFRQLVSIYRVVGFLNSLKPNQKWGEMKRKGFITTPST